MSDDLIKRLRFNEWLDPILPEAADRIEELKRDQKQGAKDYCALMEKHDALHVKLAKAAAYLQKISRHANRSCSAIAARALAELEKK
jgi:hypothetical protein